MYNLHLWLGIPGERRVWLEQFNGIAKILKNISPYFNSIKIFVDGMTAYDGERIEVKDNLQAFEKISYFIYKEFLNEGISEEFDEFKAFHQEYFNEFSSYELTSNVKQDNANSQALNLKQDKPNSQNENSTHKNANSQSINSTQDSKSPQGSSSEQNRAFVNLKQDNTNVQAFYQTQENSYTTEQNIKNISPENTFSSKEPQNSNHHNDGSVNAYFVNSQAFTKDDFSSENLQAKYSNPQGYNSKQDNVKILIPTQEKPYKVEQDREISQSPHKHTQTNTKLNFLKLENNSFQIKGEHIDIKLKSLSGYDYRTKICYCAMTDLAISDLSTTALVPFHFCKKPGVGFVFVVHHFADIVRFEKDIPHFYGIKKESLITTNKRNALSADFHIPPEHIYNLTAQVLEELSLENKLKGFSKDKPLKMHRLKEAPVSLYAKKYELDTQFGTSFSLAQAALALHNEEKLKELEVNSQKKFEDFITSQKALPALQEQAKAKGLELDNQIKTLELIKLSKELGISINNINKELVYINENQSAAKRIKNHLAFKLGQAIILNSKSFIGYIRMLYVLSYIKEEHKAKTDTYNKNLSLGLVKPLPDIKTLPDYEEALKIKQSLSYQLGTAFMKAYKNLYSGGLLKFWFIESKQITKAFKKNKQKRSSNE